MNPNDTEQNKHTPGPWRNVVLHPASILTPGQRGCDAIEIRSSDGRGSLLNDDRAIANARFIVRACNAYESDQAKIAALKHGLTQLLNATPEDWQNAANYARAIIAKS